LLQRLPGEEQSGQLDPDAWDRAGTLAQTLKPEELLGLPPEDVMRRLFWQESLEHYAPLIPHFVCTCSRERIGRMLVSLGAEEVDSIVEEQGTVTVTCDFCHRTYVFDSVDVAQLFALGGTHVADETRH
jgi:molecular chaperone Hsp33